MVGNELGPHHESLAIPPPVCVVPEKGKAMILITGASGMVGRAVLEAVRKTGRPVKAMYRNVGDARKSPPGTPTVLADFADKSSLTKALEGVETVFLVCSPIPQLVELE